MHNCRLTRNRLLDLTLDEVAPSEAMQLLAELDHCPSCQEEYATLRNTWRVSGNALRSVLPTEDFWPGHHARLRARLTNASSPAMPLRFSLSERVWIALRQMATTSVRVPVPAVVAMTLLLIGISVFAVRSREQATITPLNSSTPAETRTVWVPVVQEKVVTRVVYLEKRNRDRGGAGRSDMSKSNAAINLARATPDASGKTAMSLVDFKPTDQIKLTIIKRGYQDEK